MLRSLEVVVRDASGSSGITTNATVEDVLVTHPGAESDLRAVRPFGNATIADSTIAINGGKGVEVADPDTHATVRDTAVSTGFVGVSVVSNSGAASLTLERVQVNAQRGAVSVGGQQANVTAVNALLRTRGDLDEAVEALRGTFPATT